MKILAAMTGLLMISATLCTAQTSSGRRTRGMRPYPPDGKITRHSHPAELVISLDQLIERSKLIVDGTVLSNLPSITPNSDPDIPVVQTDSLVSVTEVLSGTLPDGTMTILLAQVGGKAGKWDVVVLDDPLVKPGERYILFWAPIT